SVPMGQLDEKRKKLLLTALEDYEKTLLFTAERPESQLSLALFYLARGKKGKAEEAYIEALRLQEKFVPVYVNYSNFLLSEGKKEEAYEMLQKGLKNVPNVGILYHALGLWYIRNKEKSKALKALKKAYTLEPDNTRFSYVYAVALSETNTKEAVEVLEAIYPKHTGNVQVVSGLVYYYQQIGESEKSAEFKKKLKALQHFEVR
ncbi:MAG TPA: hypothetical protein EYH42_04220, partial [Sulfurovum sp.]|nr:hypothetical protein [Sulfurovum sp.]